MNARLASQVSDYEARAEAASYQQQQHMGSKEEGPPASSASPHFSRGDALPSSSYTSSEEGAVATKQAGKLNIKSEAVADRSRTVITDAGSPTSSSSHDHTPAPPLQQQPALAASKAHSARLIHKLPDNPNAFHSSNSIRVGDRVIVTSGPLSCSTNVGAHAGIVTLVDLNGAWCNFRSDFDQVEYQNIPTDAIRLIESAEYMRVGGDAVKLENAVPEALVPPQAPTSDTSGYRTSDKIEYFDGRTNKWSPGIVLKRWPSETYDLMMDRGGEIVSGVAPAAMRIRHASSSRPSSGRSRKQAPDLVALGTKVDARYRNSSKWYPGVVREHLVDGTYSIHFDDGEIEDHVPVDHVRASSVPESVKADAIKPAGVFKLGDKVDVNYKGNGIWYSGIIHQENPDGTYDINYDDGATEVMVRSGQMRRAVAVDMPTPDSTSGASSRGFSPSGTAAEVHSFGAAGSASVFPAGTVVEARYKGRQWIPARVISEDCQTLYNVVFLDGTKSTVPQDKLFQVSESVPIELNNHAIARIEDGEFLATLVDKVVLYNYTVEYLSNGERETNLAMNKVRVLSPSNASLVNNSSSGGGDSSNGAPNALVQETDALTANAGSSMPTFHYFPVGAKISVHNPMTGGYLPATIERHLDNGYYDVVCLNGDRMKQVSPDSVKTLDNSAVGAAAAVASAPAQPSAATPSVTAKSNSPRAAAESRKSKKSSSAPAKVLSKGMRVEVRYRGGDEWMAATIVRENADGTVDVDYDEGEREKKVHKDNVRIAGEWMCVL
jgi:hypothetical protein